MDNRLFVLMGSACLIFAMFLAWSKPGGGTYGFFLLAGVVLALAPLYSRLRFEKNENGIKLYLVTPDIDDQIKAMRAQAEIRQQLQSVREKQKTQKNQSAETQKLLAKQEKELARKEEELIKKQRELSAAKSDDGCLSTIGAFTVTIVVIFFILSSAHPGH